jgi:maltose alpha-D-glucosyltransferase/alpha-amylase
MKGLKSCCQYIFMCALILTISCKKKTAVELTKNAWYKNQIIYNLDVKTFKDSDGDGTGDFKGLTSKLPYLQSLGITMIWLAPFQPSPLKDDGYDITDYYGIVAKLGSKKDFDVFMATAKKMKIHVIMDIVLNHSSIQHPWFLKASKDSGSKQHNFYLWAKKRPDDWNEGMGFPGVENATWTYNKTAKAYYFHRFYSFEPDLNFQNPEIEQEAKRIVAYWLDQGMDGFRFDAVPFMIDDPRKSSKTPKHDFYLLHQLVAFIKQKKPDALLLGEANVEPKENKDYFSKHNDGLDMMFNFYANEYLFYALATGDTKLFKNALDKTRDKPPAAQWAYFLRNHDEVDLGRLNAHQLKQAEKSMGPDTNMLLYKRGIRRRLAPMLNNDPKRLQMAYSLLFALPGTPLIRSGEEIGMGEDLNLKERLAIRTPMQWDTTMNSGFSAAQKTFRPLINTGVYGFQNVNVSSETADAHSLLNFIKKMVIVRKKHPEIGFSLWHTLDAGSTRLFTLLYQYQGHELLMCYNFDSRPEKASIMIKPDIKDSVLELVNNKYEHLIIKDHNIRINLGAYDFKWYQLN